MSESSTRLSRALVNQRPRETISPKRRSFSPSLFSTSCLLVTFEPLLMGQDVLLTYAEFCDIAFGICRIRHSTRQHRSNSESSIHFAKIDALKVVLRIFAEGCNRAKNERTRSYCGHAHQNLLAAFRDSVSDARHNLPQLQQFFHHITDLYQRALQLILHHQHEERLIRHFVFLLVAASNGHNLLHILDDIALSLKDHPYMQLDQSSQCRYVIRNGAPGTIESRPEEEDTGINVWDDRDLNPSSMPWPFEEGANMDAVAETLSFMSPSDIRILQAPNKRTWGTKLKESLWGFFRTLSKEPEASRPLTHTVHIRFEGTMSDVVGILPPFVDIRSMSWPDLEDPGSESVSRETEEDHAPAPAPAPQPPPQSERTPLEEVNITRSLSTAGHLTGSDIYGTFGSSSNSRRDLSRHTEEPVHVETDSDEDQSVSASQNLRHLSSRLSGPAHEDESPTVDDENIDIRPNNNLAEGTGRSRPLDGRSGSGQTRDILSDVIVPLIMSIPIPEGSRHGSIDVTDLVRNEILRHTSGTNAENTSDTLIDVAEEVSASESISDHPTTEGGFPLGDRPTTRQSNSRYQSNDESQSLNSESRPRPWTKLVALLHPLEPVILDDALVFTEKKVTRRCGRVQRDGLFGDLQSHNECFKQSRVLQRVVSLDADEEGAYVRLPPCGPVVIYGYIMATLGIAAWLVGINVGNRTTIFEKVMDFLGIISIFWVTMFGLISLILLDANTLRNLALGRRVFRTADQVYSYCGDAVAVRTAIAMNDGLFPWLSDKDMGFVRAHLNGNIELRGGLSAKQLHRAGWVFGRDYAYDILRSLSYSTTVRNGRYHINKHESFGFPGIKNIVLYHIGEAIFT